MRVLVTGGAGFIGSHLVSELIGEGHAVIALDLAWRHEGQAHPEAIQVVGDVTSQKDCVSAVQGCDAVCHLAARVGDWGPGQSYWRINVEGTRNLLAAARNEGVRRFVLVSSLAVHRYRGYRGGDETAPRDATINAYARSKIAAEDLVWAESGNLEAAVVRPGVFPFGPSDRTSFFPLAQALERGRMGLVNSGKAVLCTAYVENLAAGLRLALERPEAAGETFVIGDDREVTWRELLDLFALKLGCPPARLSLPLAVGYPIAAAWEGLYRLFRVKRAPLLTRYRLLVAGRDCHFLSTKARRLLGYQPRIDLEEGVERTVAWYRGLEHGAKG
ncbi:MAG: NAD-dependent epimerase/dehydratase family protein [Bradymonadales bacterium]|nr:NAD-dependent epimerase/dehydratase family protein [Bradymonadales bacterium]